MRAKKLKPNDTRGRQEDQINDETIKSGVCV